MVVQGQIWDYVMFFNFFSLLRRMMTNVDAPKTKVLRCNDDNDLMTKDMIWNEIKWYIE